MITYATNKKQIAWQLGIHDSIASLCGSIFAQGIILIGQRVVSNEHHLKQSETIFVYSDTK